MGRMPHVPSDFEEHSGGLFRHSEGLFQRIQRMFEKHNPEDMIDDLEHEHRTQFHHKENVHSHHNTGEIKKLKMDHEMDKIAYFGEKQKLKTTQAN